MPISTLTLRPVWGGFIEDIKNCFLKLRLKKNVKVAQPVQTNLNSAAPITAKIEKIKYLYCYSQTRNFNVSYLHFFENFYYYPSYQSYFEKTLPLLVEEAFLKALKKGKQETSSLGLFHQIYDTIQNIGQENLRRKFKVLFFRNVFEQASALPITNFNKAMSIIKNHSSLHTDALIYLPDSYIRRRLK